VARDALVIAGVELRSRLFLGTGKYRTDEEMLASLKASGCELVTVALRRLDLDNPKQKTILDVIDWKRYRILPNTAGCQTAEEAVRVARLARAGGLPDWLVAQVKAPADPSTEVTQGRVHGEAMHEKRAPAPHLQWNSFRSADDLWNSQVEDLARLTRTMQEQSSVVRCGHYAQTAIFDRGVEHRKPDRKHCGRVHINRGDALVLVPFGRCDD